MQHRAILTLCLILFWGARTLAWEVSLHNNIEYVKASEIQSFYAFDSLKNNSNGFELTKGQLRLRFEANSHTFYLDGVKHVLIRPVLASNATAFVSKEDLIYLIDPILRPHYVTKNQLFDTIIIDPGHGGKDPGTMCPYGTEAELNLVVALKLETKLRKIFSRDLKILLTRNANETVSLKERAALAIAHPKSIVISIHGNGLGGSGANVTHGLESFIMSPLGVSGYGQTTLKPEAKTLQPGNTYNALNAVFGASIHHALIEQLHPKDRGLKRARFALVQAVPVPSVLIEQGFLSHPEEARKLFTPSYQNKIAEAICQGVTRYYNLTRFNGESQELREKADEATF